MLAPVTLALESGTHSKSPSIAQLLRDYGLHLPNLCSRERPTNEPLRACSQQCRKRRKRSKRHQRRQRSGRSMSPSMTLPPPPPVKTITKDTTRPEMVKLLVGVCFLCLSTCCHLVKMDTAHLQSRTMNCIIAAPRLSTVIRV